MGGCLWEIYLQALVNEKWVSMARFGRKTSAGPTPMRDGLVAVKEKGIEGNYGAQYELETDDCSQEPALKRIKTTGKVASVEERSGEIGSKSEALFFIMSIPEYEVYCDSCKYEASDLRPVIQWSEMAKTAVPSPKAVVEHPYPDIFFVSNP